MTDTAKQYYDTTLYQEDEDDYEENEQITPHHNPNNEYGLGDNYNEDENMGERRLDGDEEKKMFQELLFCIQGVGSIKKVNGLEIYIKHDHCEESLKDILSSVRKDGAIYPVVKLFLGEWEFLQKDLIPLLIFHKQDKRLSFIACMIICLITQMPDENCTDKARYMEYLRKYKECFIQTDLVETLINHLGDCLQNEERNQKHEQMIELIIVIFKQLLTIPDDKQNNLNTHKNLQKQLLTTFIKESVLDSFIYMTQDFTHPFFQKMSVHFLEIWYQIFKNFTPKQIYQHQEGERQAIEDIEARERSKQKKIRWLQGMRHGKFGAQLQIMRNDGSSAVVGNLYQKNIEINEVKKNLRRKPQPRMIKDQKCIVEAPNTNLINVSALEQSDKQLLQNLRSAMLDFMENSYCMLIEQIFNELTKNGELIDEFDKFHYFKLQAFMMQVCRLQAYEEQKQAEIEQRQQQQAKQAEEDKKNLFDLSKQKQQKKVQLPKPPLQINIRNIGASLQINNFEFLYSTLFSEVAKNKMSERKVKDFHAGLQLLIQFLNVIRDMASSSDEKNKKNAQILITNVFYHDLVKIAQVAFLIYKENAHHKSFLHDAIEYTHLMINMLDEYSKGKVLTIQTNKVRKAKKSKNKNRKQKIFGDVDQADLERMKKLNDEDMDEDYNPARPEDADKEIDMIAEQDADDGYDSVMDALSDDEDDYNESGTKYVERKFNFKAEISILVDYQIISKYMSILKNKDFVKNPELLRATINWFKRVANQLQATWIFFQLEYLMVFDQILNENVCNNNLMRGFTIGGPVTSQEKLVESLMNELKQVIVNIMRQFFDTFQKNSLLGIECLFRFPSKEIKDQVLTNYDDFEGGQGYNQPIQQRKLSEDDNEEEFNKKLEKEKVDPYNETNQNAAKNKQIWTEDQDNILIDNFEQFKQLGKKTCCEFLSHLIEGKTPKECYSRIKVLGLKKKNASEAKEISKLLNKKQSANLVTAKVQHAVKKFVLSKLGHNPALDQYELEKYLKFIIDIEKGYADFKKLEEDVLLFGTVDEVYDLRRAMVDYSVIAINKEQFDMLNEKAFVELLASIDISQTQKGSINFKISSNVQKDTLTQNIEVLIDTLSKMRDNGRFDKQSIDSFQIEINKPQTVQIGEEDDQEEVQRSHKKKHKLRKDGHKKSKKNKKHRKERKNSQDQEFDEINQKQLDEEMQSDHSDHSYSQADQNLNENEFTPIEKQQQIQPESRDRNLISMKSHTTIRMRVGSEQKKNNQYTNEYNDSPSTAAGMSLPKQDMSMQTFRQSLNFSRLGNDSTFDRDTGVKIISSQTTLKKNKSLVNINTPQKKKRLDDSRHEINQLSSIKRVISPIKGNNLNSSLKKSIQKKFMSDKILMELKEVKNKTSFKQKGNAIDKYLEEMKNRDTRRIKFDDINAIKMSVQQLQNFMQDAKPQKMYPIDVSVFDYPFKMIQFYHQIPEDEIIYEGELMKYLPGFSFQYFNKYGIITKNEFKYYKNELMSFKHVFPTVSVKFEDIIKVQRVKCEIPIIKHEENLYNTYQFEIFVNSFEREESSIMLPQNYIEESKVNLSQMNINNQQLQEDSLEFNKSFSFRRNTRNLQSYGGRGDRRLLESAERRRNRSLTSFSSETRFASPGHLMPKMVERRLNRFNSESNINRLNNKRVHNENKAYRQIDFQTMNLKLTNCISRVDMHTFVEDVQHDLAIPLIKEPFESRNPAAWIKNISGFQAWSSREAEWTNAESRLLFGCTSEQECDRWVVMINFAMWMKRQSQ